MKQRIVLICPYFGKLPNYFTIWLRTCEYNKDVDWLIFTDDNTKYNCPENVKIKHMSFYDFCQYIKQKSEINIELKNPYKLCDIKPLYGKILQEYIKEYDFWGHCDIDCIYGNIRKFITEDILNKYDKILFLGHLTIYRNTDVVNERYKLKMESGDYKKILMSSKNHFFDESFKFTSMNTIYKKYNLPIYMKEIYFDICPTRYKFRRSYYIEENPALEKDKNYIFEWKKGKLVSKTIKDNQIQEKEYAYVHFQKRKIENEIKQINKCEHFIFVPNKFIELHHEITYGEIKGYIKRKKIFYSVYFKQRYKNLKFKLKNILRRNKSEENRF